MPRSLHRRSYILETAVLVALVLTCGLGFYATHLERTVTSQRAIIEAPKQRCLEAQESQPNCNCGADNIQPAVPPKPRKYRQV